MLSTTFRRAAPAFAFALLVSFAAAPSFASTPRGAPTVPNPGISDQINGVSTVSSKFAWAVGAFDQGSEQDTLVLKFNGSTWKKVPSPNPGLTHGSSLAAVSADATKDAWAVGDFFDGSEQQTLILHWNGSVWSQVSSQNAPGNDFLNGVDVRSATDIWAVGQSFDNNVTSTLIEHFDGGNWTIVPSPSPSGFDELNAVSVSSASNAWAVGENFPTAGAETLILRWNGTKWNQVTGANPGVHNNILNSVSVVSSADVWAGGFDFANHGGSKNELEHWNGRTWTAA